MIAPLGAKNGKFGIDILSPRDIISGLTKVRQSTSSDIILISSRKSDVKETWVQEGRV